MKRIAVVAYGLLAYLAFLLPVGYLIAFLADAGVPKTVNRGAGPLGPALWVDLGLLLLFGLQHSVMARPGFKRRIRSWVPPSLERSTYVLVSGVVLGLLFWLWRPVPAVLWNLHGTGLEWLARAGFAGGWAVAVWATFALSHLHLFGLAQVAARVRGGEHPRLGLRTPFLYKVVRHPMTAGMILAFWSTPRMTVGHLVFAGGMTGYCLLATVLEERDLVRSFPEGYRKYRTKVPALVPLLRPGLLAPRSGGLRWELSALGVGLAVLSLLLLRGAGASAEAVEPGPEAVRGELVSDGVARTFRAFPGGRAGGDGPRPVVLALHGTRGDAERLRGFLGGELERAAAERGWMVAYPEALGGAWDDCRRAVRSPARAAGVDDVAFLRALVSRLASEHGADPERVYVVGYSGGGHMAFRIALEAPDLARAVAVFGASLPTEEASLCRWREGSVPLILVNGTRDLVNPFLGGDVIAPDGAWLGPVRSSAETAAYFRSRARHAEEVKLVAVEGGGHSVPGAASRFPGAAGATVRSYEGIREAIDFFAGHAGPRAGRVR